MALLAPTLAPPLPPPAAGLRAPRPEAAAPTSRAQGSAALRDRAQLRRKAGRTQLSDELFSLCYIAGLFYFTLPVGSEILLLRVSQLFGFPHAPAVELQVQYVILALISGFLTFATVALALAIRPVKRWWHWSAFEFVSLGVVCWIALHGFGIYRLLSLSCVGYLIPVPHC